MSTHPGASWSDYAPYLMPPVAAGAAIVPPFYGLVVKSAQQLKKPVPQMSARAVFWEGCKAAPLLSAQVGVQLGLENGFKRAFGKKESNFAFMVASAVLIAVVSAPLLAAFNGRTMGLSWTESITRRVVVGISARDCSFLISLRISEPVTKTLKQYGGDNTFVECASEFLSGAIGAVVNHPVDTAVTRWQKKLEFVPREMMRGVVARAGSIGGFTLLYWRLIKATTA